MLFRLWNNYVFSLVVVLFVLVVASCGSGTSPASEDPIPDPASDSTSDPTPDPTPDPIPDPTPEPIPDPTPGPTPDPTPGPTPNPTPDPTPNPTPEPIPDPTPNPTPDPTPEPIPLTRAVDVFYIADPLGVNETFVVSTDGLVQRNSTSASAIKGVIQAAPSPSGRYLASVRNVGSGYGLYVDDLTNGNEAVLISSNKLGLIQFASSLGHVVDFEWSPDSDYIAYTDRDVDGTIELYVVPAMGGVTVKLHPDKMSGEKVSRIHWSPDSQKVAFRANHTNGAVQDLYVTNRDGSNNLKLNPVLVNGSTVKNIAWSPNSLRLIYHVNEIIAGPLALFAVDASGKNYTKLSNEGDILGPSFWLPDGSGVVYRTDTLEGPKIRAEIFRVFPDGADVVKLNGDLPVGGNVTKLLAVSPDSGFIAYIADQDTNEVDELYVTTIDGSDNTKLNHLAPGKNILTFKWSPDGSRIVYYSSGLGTSDLYSVAIGSGTELLNMAAGFGVRRQFEWSPDSQQLAYSASQDIAGTFNLYIATPGSGTMPYKLNKFLVAGEFVNSVTWSPDGISLLYRISPDMVPDDSTVQEIYTVENIADSLPVKVNIPLASGSTVSSVAWLPAFNPSTP